MARTKDPDPRRALLEEREAEAARGGGEARVARQHAAGKLTARERIALLLDPESFVELDALKQHRCADFGMGEHRIAGDGVVTGHGLVDGRPVCVFAHDFTVFGGSVSGAHAEKVCKVLDLALEAGCPVVGLHDSGGARLQEGIVALAGYAEIFLRHALLSGAVPQIAVILGPCAGGAVHGPAIGDFVFMVRDTSYLFTSGPEVLREVTHEEVTREELGGARVHAERSGVAHFAIDGEEATLRAVRDLLSFLPASHAAPLPVVAPADAPTRRDAALATLVPEGGEPYDMRAVVRAVVDDGRFLEVHEGFAPNLLAGFARMGGRPVGVVANQPAVLSGCLDADAAVKGARFVRTCDAFGIPLLTFVDVPGFLPGAAQEWGGIARHGAKLLFAYAEATVPKITVVTRKAWGGAYGLMASKHLRADVSLAWPSAEIAVMSPDAAVGLVFRKELAAAADDPAAQRLLRERLVSDYRARFANPFQAAELGYVDAVIRPEDTRPRVVRALELLREKKQGVPRKKHGNIPL